MNILAQLPGPVPLAAIRIPVRQWHSIQGDRISDLVLEPIATSEAPSPKGAYSQAVRVRDAVYSSGIGPRDANTGAISGSTVEDQTRQAFRNLSSILSAAGASITDVVNLRAYLAEIDRDFGAFDRVCREFFVEPYPARTTIGARLLGILVEVDAVAIIRRPDKGSTP